MCATRVSAETLKGFEPIGSLPDSRLNELAGLCKLETVGKDSESFLVRNISGQAVYLLRGELVLTYPDGTSKILVGGSERSRYPLAHRGEVFTSAKAVTEVELMRIDDDLLDVMATWDQVAAVESSPKKTAKESGAFANWSMMSGMFSVSSLKYGAFSQLPPAHIDELLGRFERVTFKKGDVVIREGAEGDFYFVIETGRCRVERMVGGVSMLLAELKSGDAFGEEALVSEVKRNATVTMKSDGTLLKLSKKDFVELLREPLLQRISAEDARAKVVDGAQWIDVRYPSEYQYDKLPGAINIPLSDIRNAFGALDKGKEYVLYCQSERRSAAAAFLMAQRGYRAYVLAGGLWGETKR
ncbi:MAG TPA: cyclic nucleotide-binding domain-containing protein [Burkholderiales bacterium]|nr:cyclic nucleotide-binding domain-containing protein [Burkholderiales bacterium]